MALSTVWYLGPEDVTPFNGGTWVVPCSHKDPRNPRGPNDGIDERTPLPGEFQVSGPAGSVFVQDTRTWHAGSVNQSDLERAAVVCRYAPWWLSSDDYGPEWASGRSYVPKEVYGRMKPAVQLLYRHIAEGEDDYIQPEGQRLALLSLDSRYPDDLRDNSHIVVGAMGVDEWRRSMIESSKL